MHVITYELYITIKLKKKCGEHVSQFYKYKEEANCISNKKEVKKGLYLVQK